MAETNTSRTVFKHQLALTSSELLRDPRLSQWRGCDLSLWLFDGRPARLALREQLRALGISAKVQSCYKPLLHALLEDFDDVDVVRLVIEYPVHPGADPRRFLLEAYPLGQLWPHVELVYLPRPQSEASEQPAYRVTLTDRRGASQVHEIVAPNWVKKDWFSNTPLLCPTGYLRVVERATQKLLHCEIFQTEYEQAYATIMQWLQEHAWGTQTPYFERLVLRVDYPGHELVDDRGRLILSTYEALHEDLYFSALEFFQDYSQRPAGDRGLQPGQIVPDVRAGTGGVSIQIEKYPVNSNIRPLVTRPQPVPMDESLLLDDALLAQQREPLSEEQVNASLNKLSLQTFQCPSRQGRAVWGGIRAGSLPPVLVTAGQHANEPSGVVGALRGARWLEKQAGAHFAVVPLENPDGYALFTEYRGLHPQHMHHAARYTGLGDDLEYREHAPWYEAQARRQAVSLTQAQLHISLHGYPAHEWTRPLTGYVPRGFASWSIPKGFFLIVRYQAASQALALRWLEALTLDLSKLPGLVAFNRAQIALYETHAGPLPFILKHGIACQLTEHEQQPVAVKLVTEFPDETIFGAEFKFAQQLQTDTVRLASLHWWRLNASALA